MYAGIAFSIALRYRNACSPTLTTNQNVADTNGPSEAVSKRAYTSGVCTSVHMQHVSKSARVLWGRYMQQFKAIFWREITYLSNLLETVLFYCERQENSHASWLKSLPLGEPSQHPQRSCYSESEWIIDFQQEIIKVNERVEMANGPVQQDIQLSLYSVIDRPRCPVIVRVVFKWRLVAHRRCFFPALWGSANGKHPPVRGGHVRVWKKM